MIMTLVFRFFGAAIAIGLAFSIANAQEKKIKREQLPPAVEQTVAKESQGATIKGFATEVEHGQRFYEASLIVNSHSKDILIDKAGKIVEVEEEVSIDSLPAAVQDALKRAASLPQRAEEGRDGRRLRKRHYQLSHRPWCGLRGL